MSQNKKPKEHLFFFLPWKPWEEILAGTTVVSLKNKKCGRCLAKWEMKTKFIFPLNTTLPSPELWVGRKPYVGLGKHTKRENVPYLLNLGHQSLPVGQKFQCDPVNPSRQQSNHYFCLELRDAHHISPCSQPPAITWQMLITYLVLGGTGL